MRAPGFHPRQPHWVVLASLLLFLLQPVIGLAFNLGEKVQLHGFLSQGYLHSWDNNFLGDTKDGSFRFSEVGLNLNAQLSDRFRLGGQLLYCQPPYASKGKVKEDWLVAEYHLSDPLAIRAGKVKMPMGLYNMERDSDFLRQLIFLPQSIYDETRRDSWLAHWGGELYGNLAVGQSSDIDYQLFAGRIRYSNDSLATLAEAASGGRTGSGPGGGNRANSANRDRTNDYVFGTAFFINSTIDGLRAGLTFLSMEDETWLGDTLVLQNQIKSKVVLSLEYAWQQFSISAEYCESDRRLVQHGVTVLDGPSQAWYLLASYALREDLVFSLLYDEYYRLKNDHHAITSTSNQYPWRKDLALALRYDLSQELTLKAEWHTIDGTALYMGYFNPDGLERYWQYGALKATFNF